jgi:hypothetical protein
MNYWAGLHNPSDAENIKVVLMVIFVLRLLLLLLHHRRLRDDLLGEIFA